MILHVMVTMLLPGCIRQVVLRNTGPVITDDHWYIHGDWLQLECPRDHIFHTFNFIIHGNYRAPKKGRFYGSNDGITWDTTY
jgi:hypothetical protein